MAAVFVDVRPRRAGARRRVSTWLSRDAILSTSTQAGRQTHLPRSLTLLRQYRCDACTSRNQVSRRQAICSPTDCIWKRASYSLPCCPLANAVDARIPPSSERDRMRKRDRRTGGSQHVLHFGGNSLTSETIQSLDQLENWFRLWIEVPPTAFLT